MTLRIFCRPRLSALLPLLCGALLAPFALADTALPSYQPQAVPVPANALYLSPQGAIRIAGAEHVRYIVERFNTQLQTHHPEWVFADESKGTSSAVPLLTHGFTLFGAMGRAINPLETKAYRKIVGAAPLEIRVAHTGNDTSEHLATSLAVYVNRANPIEQLSSRQVARMLSIGNPEGDLSRWGQVGLKKEWSNRVIHPYGTPEFTGFGTSMQKDHLRGLPLAPTYESYDNTEAILARLADDPAGLAVAAIGLSNARIKSLAILDPATGKLSTGTPEEVRAGAYPYGRFLYFYLRKEPGKALDPLAVEYLRFVLSREGQAIIASQDKGYIPLTADEAAVELAKLEKVSRP